jgi:putative glutamine amidotransferase
MATRKRRSLFVAVSVNFMAASRDRPFYIGKPLQYSEASLLEWIRSGGALPFLVPDLRDRDALDETAEHFDGLVLSGGADVSPTSYREEPIRPEWSGDASRDAYEIALLDAFRRHDKPVLGVCRGHQLLNVALGGTLYQDLLQQGVAVRPHRDAVIYDELNHGLRIQPGSWLHELYGVENAITNSIHHQGVKDLAPGLEPAAWSEEGIVEAIRDPKARFTVGVQWHPEWMRKDAQGHLDSAPLLQAFLAACRESASPAE